MTEVMGGVVLGRALKRVGVETAFFLLGGPMQPLIWELSRQGIRLIDVRHEQAAAMMAHAYSRVTGKVGVCITASGVAAVNAATGIAVANDDCAPVVAISGSVTMDSRGTGSFEEMDQVQLMRPITKEAWQIQTIGSIPRFVEMAFRHATANRPGPVYLDLPANILWDTVNEDEVVFPNSQPHTTRPLADERSIEQAVCLLSQAERPILIAGSGAVWSEAGPELREFVEVTRIPFYTTPQARGLIPEDHYMFFGAARSYALQNADVALVVATRANWMVQHLLPPRFAEDLKVVMVNLDANEIGQNRSVEVGLVGDARAVMRQLTETARDRFMTKDPARHAWIAKLKEVDADREARTWPLLKSNAKPIHPLRLCNEIREFLPKDSILVADGNEIMNFARQSIPSYYPRQRLNPGVSTCMGVGVPFGIGAKVAKPEKPVLVLSGDGAFGFNGMELDTAVRHCVNVVVVVSNNGGWSGTDEAEGPRWPTGQHLGFTSYDKVMEAFGGWAKKVEDPDDIRPALEMAFASGRPALINAIVAPARAATQVSASNKRASI